ncbi:MAG: hydrogenase maturation nickel metallochaperone HypA [Candidatus Omnitrophica bacterium CG_4_9_14_0_2_um_filter_42_8]|nr:MAG: hydrogenase maturation nickel metallochaperone HypA [Candidatus Omnitrophica bacterium CG22_combo_CG10-13_8_21_14_all_43_16]PJC47902.1 MAG: hydrogenase maturation nickel metallochaperone HypA [Candidatus Omnitrophica bacterium CG_4_9_14_0_2_um_filter_42_8]
MHEYHIVEGAVKQMLEKAKSSNATRVTRVTLVMGEFSGLKEGPVRSYFENFSKSTLLEGAELIIKPVGAKDCAGPGKEFYIDNIEIES